MAAFHIEVPIPSMGATVNELTIINLKAKPGDAIRKGQQLAELESDKSVFEYEAPCDGTLVAFHVLPGAIVPAGAPFLSIETSDEAQRHLAAPLRADSNAQPSAAKAAALVWTPRALKLATEAGFDPTAITDITATGPGGRVSGDDIEKYLASHKDLPKAATSAAPAAEAPVSQTADETVCIAGVGYAVPRNVMPNSEIMKAFPDRTEEEMVRLTGIKERRHAAEDESATSLAALAANHALKQAGIKAEELDGVIFATLLPDQPVPSMASRLAQNLGVHHPLAFDINAACSGWLYALEVGRAFIRGGTAKRILVVTAELLSRITNPNDKETAFLFGDGAGAAILTDAPGGHRLHRMALSGDSDKYAAIQRPGGGALKPVPHPGGHDREHFYLQMDGSVVFKAAVVAFTDEIQKTLQRHKLKPEDISWIVPHQANERILKAVSKRVGIPYERFIVTIQKFGNTSAASVSMALGYAAEEGVFTPGDRIIFCSVGAGLTFAGGLMVW